MMRSTNQLRQTLFVLFTILTFGLSAQSIVNNSLSLDGIDDHLIMPINTGLMNFDESYTLEAWIKIDAETNETIMSKGSGNEFEPNNIFTLNVSNNEIAFQITSGNEFYPDGSSFRQWAYIPAPVIAFQWTHIAVTFNITSTRIATFYVNGAVKGSKRFAAEPNNDDGENPLYIGRQGSDCNCNFFDGLMDEVRLWSDVRTPEEIATYYNRELTGTEDNLEIYYNFNEGTGNVATDQSPNNFDATFVNGATWSTENPTHTFDNYVDFDGVSQGARVTNFTDEDSGELTIEAWIKTEVLPETGKSNTIVEFGNDSPILYMNAQNIALYIQGGNSITHDFSPYVGELTHVAATVTDGSQKLYINGVEVAYSVAGPGADPYAGAADNFGIGYNGTDHFFNGKIAEVRIWNDIRTPEELELNLRRTLNGTEPNLVAYYDFSEGEGSTLYDKTENNYDATFYDGDIPAIKPVGWTTNPEAEFPNFPEESHIYIEENSISGYDINAFLDNGASDEGLFYNRYVEDDGAYFTINDDGVFIMYDQLDYENPQDANGNNVYEVRVIATSLDSRSISYKDYFVHITNAPTIFLNTDVVDVVENTDGTILDIDARDEGMAADLGLLYSLSSTDAAIFSVDEDNGELSFISRPDFENPLDDNADNVYELIVQANTSSAVVDQIVTITVTDSDTEIAVSYAPLNEIFENAAAGQLVGEFSFDPESSPDDLVITEGAEFFEIVNGQLYTTVVFDYETASNYTVTVDYPNIETYTSIDVAVSNVVEPPTSISLSNASILENKPAGSVIGIITYSGGDGAGDNSLLSLPDGIFDNHEFAMDGNQLVSTRPYDKENDGGFVIRITYDNGLINLNKDIIIDNVNEGPYNFTFTPETVLENEENALVGELEASGDIAGLLRYEISDNELLDNALFYIVGNDVRSAALDYELKSQYQFEAIVFDEEQKFKKETFTVDVTDVAEAELTLSVAGQTIDYDGSYDFGSIVLNQPSQTKTFQIENTGVIDLALSGNPFIGITGLGASQFTIDETGMAGNLAPDATTTFTITYTPTTPGVSEAQLQIANATLIDPFVLSLEGIGLDITTSGNWKLVGGIPGKFSQDGGIGSVVYNGELYTSSVSTDPSQQGIFKLVGENLVHYGNANRQPFLYASSGGTFFTTAKLAGGNVIRSIVDYGGGSISSGNQFNVPSQPTGVGTSYESEFTMGFDSQDNSYVVYAANFAEPAAFNAATGGVYIKKFVQNGGGSEDYAQLSTQSLKPYSGNQNIYSYDIAFDGSDNLWLVSRVNESDLFLSKYNDVTVTWTHYDLTSQQVNSSFRSTDLTIEIDDSDNIHIVDKQPFNSKIEYLKVASDGSVLIAEEYTTSTGSSDDRFSFALGTDQNPIIVFQDNTTSKLRAIKYENGAFVNFRETYVTNDKAVSGDTPFKLSVDPVSGVAYIVYKSSTFLGMSIVATEEIVPELTFSVGDKVATDDEPVLLQSGVGYEKSIVLTIANEGQAIVNFTGDPRANLTGDNSDDLEIDLGEFPSSLFPGESVDVSITFNPQAAYDNLVTLSFPSNATGTGSDVQIQLLGLDNTNTGQWEVYSNVNSSQINSIDMSLKNGKPIWAVNTLKYLGGFPNPLRSNQIESLYQLELHVYDTYIEGNIDPIAWTNYYGSSTLSEGSATSWDPLFLDIFDNIRIAEDPSYGVTTISSSGISGLRSFALTPGGDFAQIPRNDQVGDLLYDKDGSFFNLQVSTNQVKVKRLSDNTIFVDISGLTNADTDASLVTYEEDLFFAYGDVNSLVVNRVAKDASYNAGITTLLTETDARFQQADETRTKDLEISKDGQLYLAYIQHSTGNVQLKSYDLLVESWTDLPQLDLSTVLDNASSIQDIQLQIHPDGTPYLSVFYDNDNFLGGNGYAKVFQLKNNEWTELGGTKISPYTGREITDTPLGATVETNLSTIRKSILQINEGGMLYLMTADKIYTLTPEPSAFDHEPSITSTPSSSVEESSLYNYAIVTEDDDAADVLTITSSDLPVWLTLVDNGDRTATLAGTPADGDVGEYSVTLTVNDGRLQRTQTVAIEVTDINTQPEFTLPSETVELTENAEEQIISITDIFDGDEFLNQGLTFSITSSNENLVNDQAITFTGGTTGSITFTPLPTRSGFTTLTVLLEDDGDPLLSLEKTIEVTVTPAAIDGALVVTTLDDAGVGSLRQAIIDANASREDDIIDLRQVAGSIELQSSLPKVTSNIIFEGSEPGTLSVSGAGQFQVFFIESGNVTMQAFSIINGRSAGGNGGSGDGGGGGGAGFGGAIFLDNGNLILDRMAFAGNTAQGGAGSNSSGVLGGTGGSSLLGNGGTGGSAPFGQPGGNGGNGPVYGTGGGGGGQGSSGFVGGRGGSGNFGGGSGGGGGSSSGDGGNRGSAGAFAGQGGAAKLGGGGGGGAGLGGAIFARSGSVIIQGSSFSSNSASGGSTGSNSGTNQTSQPSAGQGKGGAVFINNDVSFSKNNNTFSGNSASNHSGVEGTDDADIYSGSSKEASFTALSRTDMDENQSGPGVIAATLSAFTGNPLDVVSFGLASGFGDNDAFVIVENELQLNDGVTLDFETKASYSIKVETSINSVLTEQEFTLNVNDLNEAATDFTMSVLSIDEGQAIGVAVGLFSATDEDATNTHVYSLVDGFGDNASFQITGSDLQAAEVFDFDDKTSYSIQVELDDSGLKITREFTVTVNNINIIPTSITLSNATIPENKFGDFTIGTLDGVDTDDADTHIFQFTSTNSFETPDFKIVGDQLKTNRNFDFETEPTVNVEIKALDNNNEQVVKTLTISFTDTNDGISAINISSSEVAEGQPAGTEIGLLSAIDQDAGDTHTFTLVSGFGENYACNIVGNSLQTVFELNFDFLPTLNLKINVNDGNGGINEFELTVTTTDANHVPTAISLSANRINENVAVNTVIGSLSTTDEDATDTHSYSLVSGYGDNANFAISGSDLTNASVFDFETKSSYSIKVKTDDAKSGTFEQEFTVSIDNINETPTGITLSNNSIIEEAGVGSLIGQMSAIDMDGGVYAFTFTSGYDDNSLVSIDGSSLNVGASLDFETKPIFIVGVTVTDTDTGDSFNSELTINVTDANDGPTQSALSNNLVDENVPIGTVIGSFTTTDQDANDTHTYQLQTTFDFEINGVNRSPIAIVGNNLMTDVEFDFELFSTFQIRVLIEDSGTASIVKDFTIIVNDVNETPSAISLSNSLIDEDAVIGSIIGILTTTDVDVTDTHTYEVLTSFTLDGITGFPVIANGANLVTTVPLDFEVYPSFTLKVKTTDDGGLSFIETFTITANDVNDAPKAIALTSNSIDENLSIGSKIGDLSTTDQDAGNTHTYTLVSGFGDNSLFSISSSELVSGQVFDFETKRTYSIKVKTDDGNGGAFEQELTITVSDANDTPTAISLSVNSIDENTAANTVIGSLSTTDIDTGDLHTYTLVSGFGGNASFAISGANLTNVSAFDFETKSSYSIKVKTDDGKGGTFEQEFTITVKDINEGSAQSITFSSLPNKTFGDVQFDLAATASSGLAVSYSSSNLAVATISGNTVTIVSPGETNITASQAGGTGFEAAPNVTQKLVVEKASQTITFDEIPDQVSGADPITLAATASSGFDVSYSATGPVTLSGSTLTLTGVGQVIVTASQSGNSDYLSASTTRAFVVTDPAKSDQVITFNAPTAVYINEGTVILEASSDSGLAIEFEIITGNQFATLSGDNLHPSAVGTIEVSVKQAGDNTFNPATKVATIEIKPIFTLSGTVVDENDVTFTAGTLLAFRVEDQTVYLANLTESGYSESFKDGTYYLAVEPTNASNYYTTLYGDVIFWESTTPVTVNSNMGDLDIKMVVKSSDDLLTGNGTLIGRIIDAGNTGGRIIQGQIMEGEPIEGVSVFLIRISDDQIMTEVISDANGDFEIVGIPEGEYRLQIEVTGVAMDLGSAAINVDAEGTPVVLTAMVGEDGIVLEEVITSLNELFTSSVKVYPNPFNHQLNFQIENELLGQIDLQIISTDGRVLFASSFDKNSLKYNLQLDNLNVPSGMLILRMVHEDAVATFKLLKK